ncbi:unnamed protein product, partial [Mesorhabditis spiculigera]
MFPKVNDKKIPKEIRDKLTEPALQLHKFSSFDRNEPSTLASICELIAGFMDVDPVEMLALDKDTSLHAAKMRNLLRLMKDRNVFKIDEKEGFLLKSGQISPIYIDLRESFGYPDVMELACDCLREMIATMPGHYDGIVGVPYAALPYSAVVSLQLRKPLIIIRKEAKSYGTKKLIEGRYEKGQTVVIIEDVVTTGGSIKDVVKILREDGLIVQDVFCLLDRQQGGAAKLKEDGINLHSLMNMELVLSFLVSVGALNHDQFEQERRLSLAERKESTSNKLNKRIIELMLQKKSNLCIAIDYKETEQILKLAETAGPYIIAAKIHADIIENFNKDFTDKLAQLAEKHNFLIFEDRKFADIGNVIDLQLAGTHRIGQWADIVTCHAVQGAESITNAFRKHIALDSTKLGGILLIAELSSKGALTDAKYAQEAIAVGEANEDVVCGFICQDRASSRPGQLNWTPGVNIDKRGDGAGQQWRTVEQAVVEQENDIVIVGRAISEAADPSAELERYRTAAWAALTGEKE